MKVFDYVFKNKPPFVVKKGYFEERYPTNVLCICLTL